MTHKRVLPRDNYSVRNHLEFLPSGLVWTTIFLLLGPTPMLLYAAILMVQLLYFLRSVRTTVSLATSVTLTTPLSLCPFLCQEIVYPSTTSWLTLIGDHSTFTAVEFNAVRFFRVGAMLGATRLTRTKEIHITTYQLICYQTFNINIVHINS